MSRLFIDSGPLVAVINPRDQYQQLARTGWLTLAGDPRQLFSSEHVMDEVATAICRTQGARRAAEWVRDQLDSGLVRWLSTAPDDLRAATDWLEKYADQRVNFTDAISFVLMKREQIGEVFTFDRHFGLAGFGCWTG